MKGGGREEEVESPGPEMGGTRRGGLIPTPRGELSRLDKERDMGGRQRRHGRQGKRADTSKRLPEEVERKAWRIVRDQLIEVGQRMEHPSCTVAVAAPYTAHINPPVMDWQRERGRNEEEEEEGVGGRAPQTATGYVKVIVEEHCGIEVQWRLWPYRAW